MLSKRNLFTMLTIIVVVLVIFLLPRVLSEYYNEYDVNHMAPAETIAKREEDPDWDSQKQQVIYIGETENGYLDVAKEWVYYRKKVLTAFSSLDEASEMMSAVSKQQDCLLVDGELLETNTQSAVQMLSDYIGQGGVVIFYRLPSYATIRGSVDLQNLLGVQQLRAESVKLQEIRLYEGFLLGGETHYSFVDQRDTDLADMDREIPWYDISARTKTYMVGFLSDEEKNSLGIENEDMPAIIWRCNAEDGSVFAVNGDYLLTAGLGLLDAMLYEVHEYSLYSVVNAQNLSITGFPALTDDESAYITEIYGMTAEQFCRDILWPSFVAATQKAGWKITSFVSVKQNNDSLNTPNLNPLIDYLKFFNEVSTEAGVSLGRINSTNLLQAVKDEKEALDILKLNYLFACGYIREENKANLSDLLQSNGQMTYFDDIRTVVGEYAQGEWVLSWLTDKITQQNATTNAYRHSDRDSLRLKSLETALGYSNVQVDIFRVLNPDSEKDEWENLADKMAANIDTYWKPFSVFDKTTISQSDARVRNFLNGSVTSEKSGNCISVQTDGFTGDAYLLLRTHGEQVVSMTGGSFELIENDVYLLHLTSDTAEITLKSQIQPDYS